jgi:hypothetical protein
MSSLKKHDSIFSLAKPKRRLSMRTFVKVNVAACMQAYANMFVPRRMLFALLLLNQARGEKLKRAQQRQQLIPFLSIPFHDAVLTLNVRNEDIFQPFVMPSRLCLCNNFNNSIFSLRAHTPIDR